MYVLCTLAGGVSGDLSLGLERCLNLRCLSLESSSGIFMDNTCIDNSYVKYDVVHKEQSAILFCSRLLLFVA